MLRVVPLLFALPMSAGVDGPAGPLPPAMLEPVVSVEEERTSHLVPVLRERSKKEIWLLEKAWRPRVRVPDPELVARRREKETRAKGSLCNQAEARLSEPIAAVGSRIEPVTTLYSIWNREAVPLIPGQPYKLRFQFFLRDHYTNQSTQADARLAGVLAAAAIRFRAPRVEIVSGFRSLKYNLMLRKKGHQVARESQHLQGTAVDFRIRGVPTEVLREFVRSLRLGGVGFYPRTRFVHADTGKVRYWNGS